MVHNVTMIMSILRRSSELPDPNGELASKVPHTAIVSANKVVSEVYKKARSIQKRVKYNKYTPEVQANIGRMASLISPHSTVVQYTKLLGKNVRENTVREIFIENCVLENGDWLMIVSCSRFHLRNEESHCCWVVK